MNFFLSGEARGVSSGPVRLWRGVQLRAINLGHILFRARLMRRKYHLDDGRFLLLSFLSE